MKIRSAAASDIGCIRKENEDSLLCDDTLGLYAVADGIGGLPGGAQASQKALEVFQNWFATNAGAGDLNYADAVDAANDAVVALGRKVSPRSGIGTTVTLAHVFGDTLASVHVGDSALFRLRAGRLEELTVEHNLENEIKIRTARGEQVSLTHENRAALTRCVGQPPPLEGDILKVLLEAGDRYLLCTDGITRCITTRELTRFLGEADSPEAAVQTLVDMARDRGGIDNATAVVLFVEA